MQGRDCILSTLGARAVVTGGAGFIGSHVVKRLVGAGVTVLVVDDLSAGSATNLISPAALQAVDVRSSAARRRS